VHFASVSKPTWLAQTFTAATYTMIVADMTTTANFTYSMGTMGRLITIITDARVLFGATTVSAAVQTAYRG